MYQIGAIGKDDAVWHQTMVASHTAVPIGTAKWLEWDCSPNNSSLPLR